MKLIQQKDINAWLRSLASQAKLIIAAEVNGILLYTPYQEGLEPVLQGIPTLSAKGIVFPQTETMLEFRVAGEDKAEKITLEVPYDTTETIVFGVRPCDAHGIAIIEKIFTKGCYKDPYFKERRKHTTIIAVSCSEPPTDTCFCPTVGSSPTGSEGADLILTKLEDEDKDKLLVKDITPKGEALIKDAYFKPTNLDNMDNLLRVKQHALTKMSDCPQLGDKEKLAQHLEDLFPTEFWKQISAACIGCNICTYMCPTCHCFNITDEMRSLYQGERIRTWDSCLKCQYSLETSGHNPRADNSQRYRNRINHKFSYLIKNAGIIGCVGCGRCIRNCPVSLDIREVVEKILEISAQT